MMRKQIRFPRVSAVQQRIMPNGEIKTEIEFSYGSQGTIAILRDVTVSAGLPSVGDHYVLELRPDPNYNPDDGCGREGSE
jgi:hypothetical protein